MSTKVGPLNQHDFLHPHYGQADCCLCKAEYRITRLKEILTKFCEVMKKQENLPPEITKLVDEHFWELV